MNVQPIDVAIFTLTSPWPSIAVVTVALLGVGLSAYFKWDDQRRQS